MAYPYNFIKVTFGGKLRDTEEIWACGFHLAKRTENISVTEFETKGPTDITLIANEIKAFYNETNNLIPTYMRLEWVKLALIGTNGKYQTAPVEYEYSPASGGGSGQGFVPSTAAVITLVADKYKDPGKYNRFYIPICAPQATNQFVMTNAHIESLATTAAEMVRDINSGTTIGGSELNVTAVSQRVTSYLPIASVKVGNVIDVQRRRRNKLVETYKEQNV